ncbi:hypothetical protein QYF36_020096 [Acer negundo]|nr:hypothetical protein QYF36_020096 [Acer negundo]
MEGRGADFGSWLKAVPPVRFKGSNQREKKESDGSFGSRADEDWDDTSDKRRREIQAGMAMDRIGQETPIAPPPCRRCTPSSPSPSSLHLKTIWVEDEDIGVDLVASIRGVEPIKAIDPSIATRMDPELSLIKAGSGGSNQHSKDEMRPKISCEKEVEMIVTMEGVENVVEDGIPIRGRGCAFLN